MIPDHVCVQVKTVEPGFNFNERWIGETVLLKQLSGSPIAVGLAHDWEVGGGVLGGVRFMNNALASAQSLDGHW